MKYKIGMIRSKTTACWIVRGVDSRPIGRFASVELHGVTGEFRTVARSGWFEVDGDLRVEGEIAIITPVSQGKPECEVVIHRG